MGLEVRRVARQKDDLDPVRLDGRDHALAPVGGQVVHEQHIAGPQARSQAALQEHEEGVAVHAAFDLHMLVSSPSRLMAPTSERLGGVLRGTVRSTKRTSRGARP